MPDTNKKHGASSRGMPTPLLPAENIRPWGYYEILADQPDHKVKRITVYPGQRLSYQRHHHRSEHWFVIAGQALVTQNGEPTGLSPGQAIDLPILTWHRVCNTGQGDLVFIEIQTGSSFDEEDIERSEDDYGRIG